MKPPEAEVRALATAWLAKARLDLLVCDNLTTQDADVWEAVAFHCQQAVEKALKAVLVRHQVESPRRTMCSAFSIFSPRQTPLWSRSHWTPSS
jgi:hypothetical protein